jgi:hypothetical protein
LPNAEVKTMPRRGTETALQLITRDDPPPPKDWVPDKFEERFGGPIGTIYHTAQGYKRLGFGATTSVPAKPVAVKAVMDFLATNHGWYTSIEISRAIGMKAGNVLTVLRAEGKVSSRRESHIYVYCGRKN